MERKTGWKKRKKGKRHSAVLAVWLSAVLAVHMGGCLLVYAQEEGPLFIEEETAGTPENDSEIFYEETPETEISGPEVPLENGAEPSVEEASDTETLEPGAPLENGAEPSVEEASDTETPEPETPREETPNTEDAEPEGPVEGMPDTEFSEPNESSAEDAEPSDAGFFQKGKSMARTARKPGRHLALGRKPHSMLPQEKR